MCGFGAVVCSWSLLIRWAQRARCQAETPLIALFRFPRPALGPLTRGSGFDAGGALCALISVTAAHVNSQAAYRWQRDRTVRVGKAEHIPPALFSRFWHRLVHLEAGEPLGIARH